MPKILIIEDEEITALALESFCKNLGYSVLPSTNNYEDAIHTIHIQRPDLLICDIMLNDKATGLDIAKIAQDKYGVATVFLTAFYNEDILKKAKKINFYGYIIKPYKEKELEATLRLALAQVDKNRTVKKRYIDINGYTFDTKTQKLYNEEKEIYLGNKAERLIYFLSKYMNEVKKYEEIIDFVYEGKKVSIDTLRHLVKRTRNIIKKENIQSIRGIGYKLIAK